MSAIDNLSKNSIAEDYEDLIFRKAMAIYVEEEYEKIEAEDPNFEFVPHDTNPKWVENIYKKQNLKSNIKHFLSVSKKVFNAVAVAVFAVIISLSSAVVAFAGVRETVTDIIYHLVYENNERYTLVSVGESTGFVNPEDYNWEGAYAPTYLPGGYTFYKKDVSNNIATVLYKKENQILSLDQTTNLSFTHIDTENADDVENIYVNNSEGLLVKKNGVTTICWNTGNTFLVVTGKESPKEMLLFAENMQLLN